MNYINRCEKGEIPSRTDGHKCYSPREIPKVSDGKLHVSSLNLLQRSSLKRQNFANTEQTGFLVLWLMKVSFFENRSIYG